MTSPKWQRLQILSLDGGGIKGLFSAAVLANLEDDLRINITDHFDLIVGTSTGGIIALALGLGIKPKEIVQLYIEKAPKIFNGLPAINRTKHWVYHKFSQTAFQTALQECFEDKRLADSRKRLVIPSYNLGEDDVYLFKTPHHERLKRDFKTPMWNVAFATSAAPTYFPAFKEINSIRFIDGGIWANNPTMIGIVEAISMLGASLQAISVFSLGTSDAVVQRPERLNWGGKIVWVNSVVDVIMRSQSLGVYKQALHLLGEDKIKRLDPKVPEGLFAFDRISTAELLSKAAHESRTFCPTFEKVFRSHIAPEYKPFYM